MREDVRRRYTGAEDRAIVDDAIVSQLTYDEAGERFEAGDVEGIVRVFTVA